MSERSVARRVQKLAGVSYEAALMRVRNEKLRTLASDVKRDDPAKSYSDCLVEVVANTFDRCACGRPFAGEGYVKVCPECLRPSKECRCPTPR